MLENPASRKRFFVGAVAAAATLTSIIIWFFYPEHSQTAGVLIRLGIILGALCLAMPSENQQAAWAKLSPLAMIGIFVGIFLSLRYPLILGPVIVLLGLLSMFSLRKQNKNNHSP